MSLSRRLWGSSSTPSGLGPNTPQSWVLHGILGERRRSVRGGRSEVAPAFGLRVLEAPLSLRRITPSLAPRQPVPRSQSAGETGRTPNAGASNPPPDLPAFIRSPRNPVMNRILTSVRNASAPATGSSTVRTSARPRRSSPASAASRTPRWPSRRAAGAAACRGSRRPSARAVGRPG